MPPASTAPFPLPLYTSDCTLIGPPSSPASSASAPAVATTISVGDNLPDANLSYFDSDGELQTITISDLTKGKKAILFAVPVPLRRRARRSTSLDLWKRLGSCMPKAWTPLPVSREFTLALGVELDLSDELMGIGVRSWHYALLVEDGVVKVLNLEDGGLASFVEYIPNARVPLLKYISRQLNISFDVSVNNHLGVMKSNILKWLSEIDDCFRDMVLVEWAKAQDINDPKSRSLSSYALCLLTCEPPIFPPLRAIINEERISDRGWSNFSGSPFEDVCSANIQRFRSSRIINQSSLAQLLLSFFDKVEGRDMVLVDALSRRIPLVSDQPTIIFGADVTHSHPWEDYSSPSIVVVLLTKFPSMPPTFQVTSNVVQDLTITNASKAYFCHEGKSRTA
ncbi:hypothetical protein ZIOFF_030121 [Zingiber officinale]|uniref:Poly(A) RNA polymerase mitochondrial-like central palm domain-containing protein n=1 Tax=Zingiber officinale TaxID=94328 RepID=A0A8J5GQM2_ZINOF|nr:hypothetical protein ZIOFF_030121 [Zingiber officinale]